MLLQLIDVPRWFLINLCSCVSVSVGVTRLWYSGMVFMQPGWKWIVHITVMSCCSNSCCQTSVKLLATFAFLHNVCARALSCCDTRLQTSHQGGGLFIIVAYARNLSYDFRQPYERDCTLFTKAFARTSCVNLVVNIRTHITCRTIYEKFVCSQ